MCSCPTAAAARASRANRRRAVAAVGQVRGEHLDRHGPVEGRVPGLEHHAHPALPEHLENLVRTQPAQSSRLVRDRADRGNRSRPSAVIGAGLVLLGFQGSGCQTDRGAGTRARPRRAAGVRRPRAGWPPPAAPAPGGTPRRIPDGSASSACSASESRSSRERRRRYESQGCGFAAMVVLSWVAMAGIMTTEVIPLQPASITARSRAMTRLLAM